MENIIQKKNIFDENGGKILHQITSVKSFKI